MRIIRIGLATLLLVGAASCLEGCAVLGGAGRAVGAVGSAVGTTVSTTVKTAGKVVEAALPN